MCKWIRPANIMVRESNSKTNSPPGTGATHQQRTLPSSSEACTGRDSHTCFHLWSICPVSGCLLATLQLENALEGKGASHAVLAGVILGGSPCEVPKVPFEFLGSGHPLTTTHCNTTAPHISECYHPRLSYHAVTTFHFCPPCWKHATFLVDTP